MDGFGGMDEEERKEEEEISSSSSIGRNTDGSDDDDEEEEVGSEVKTGFTSLGSLEESLPIRKGLSKHYIGKSKSFISLGDASSLSIKDLTKPESVYERKRNLDLRGSWDKIFDERSRTTTVSKRVVNYVDGALASPVVVSSNDHSNDSRNATKQHSTLRILPPPYPQKKRPEVDPWVLSPQKSSVPPFRSFSSPDLQNAPTANPSEPSDDVTTSSSTTEVCDDTTTSSPPTEACEDATTLSTPSEVSEDAATSNK